MDAALLSRLDEVLKRTHPYLYKQLRTGAKIEEVVSSWAEVGVHQLPDEYLALMSWHDGTGEFGEFIELIPNYGALFDHRYARSVWSGLADGVESLQRKIPVLNGEEHHVVLDIDTGRLWDWEPGDLHPTFDSLDSLIRTTIEWYSEGQIRVRDEEHAVITDDGAFRAVHARLNPWSDPPPWAPYYE